MAGQPAPAAFTKPEKYSAAASNRVNEQRAMPACQRLTCSTRVRASRLSVNMICMTTLRE